MTSVPMPLTKIQLIIDKLRYRQHELEDEFYRSNNDSGRSLMEMINTAGNIMDTDDTAELDPTTDNVKTIDLSSFYGLKLNSETDQ